MVASPLEKPGEYAFVYQMGIFHSTLVWWQGRAI
jgi:hypothetical protein